MIVLQVQVAYFFAVESEGDPPVTGCRHAPCSGPAAGKLVDAPAWWTLHAVHVRRGNKGGQDAAHPVDEIAPDFAVVVVFDETL